MMQQALSDRLAQLSPAKQALFEQLRRGERAPTSPSTNANIDKPVVHAGPLSFAQERLWYLDQLAPGNPFYNVATAVRLRGRVDTTALQHALQSTIARHSGLRTTFSLVEGVPRQLVGESPFALEQLDLRSLPGGERERRLQTIA